MHDANTRKLKALKSALIHACLVVFLTRAQHKESPEALQARREEERRRCEEAYETWKKAKDAELAKLRSSESTKQQRGKSASKGRTEKAALFDEWVAAKKAEERERREQEKRAKEYVMPV